MLPVGSSIDSFGRETLPLTRKCLTKVSSKLVNFPEATICLEGVIFYKDNIKVTNTITLTLLFDHCKIYTGHCTGLEGGCGHSARCH